MNTLNLRGSKPLTGPGIVAAVIGGVALTTWWIPVIGVIAGVLALFFAWRAKKAGQSNWTWILGFIGGCVGVLVGLIATVLIFSVTSTPPDSTAADEPVEIEQVEATPESEPEQVEEPEPAEEPEPEPKDYEISYEEFSDLPATIVIDFEIEDHLTRGLIAKTAKNTTLDAIIDAIGQYPDYEQIRVTGTSPVIDDYGNEENIIGVYAVYERSTIEKINFDNRDDIEIWNIRDHGQIHPDLDK